MLARKTGIVGRLLISNATEEGFIFAKKGRILNFQIMVRASIITIVKKVNFIGSKYMELMLY